MSNDASPVSPSLSLNSKFAGHSLLPPQKPKAERENGRNLEEIELIRPEQTVYVFPIDNAGDGRNPMVTADDF